MVLEIAFDAVFPSTRHKSGLAMRFPRVHRIRWDKPHAEADRLDALTRLLPGESGQTDDRLRPP
jgi:DNA ligase-1